MADEGRQPCGQMDGDMRADGWRLRLMMIFQTEDVFRDGRMAMAKFGCSLQVLGPPGDEATAGKQGPRGAGPDDDEWNNISASTGPAESLSKYAPERPRFYF